MVEGLRRDLGSGHPETLVAIARLVELRIALGDVDSGRPLFDEILAIEPRARALGTHPNLKIDLNIANILGGLGEFGATRAHLEEVLARLQRIFGREHYSSLAVMNALARVLLAQGDTPRAVAALERIWRIREQSLGSEHPDTLTARENLAQGLEHAGRPPAAEAIKEFDRTRSAYLGVLDAWERPPEREYATPSWDWDYYSDRQGELATTSPSIAC